MSEQKELFEFNYEPIRGYPELRWTGKRPFTGTPYYPAQLKESYGDDVDGWRNKIYWGDNLQVMSHLLKDYRGKVNLIYIDPPFDSKADYKKKIELRGKAATTDSTTFEEKQYGDIWTNDEYLQFMYERLILCRELLADNGSIYLHCDWHKSHTIRMLLDELFGNECFKNEVIWQKLKAAKKQAETFGNVHDTIFFYTKNPDNFNHNKQFGSYSEELINSHYNHFDENGRRYTDDSFTQTGQGPARHFGDRGLLEPPTGKHWIWSQEKIDEGLKAGTIIFSSNGMPRVKRYLDEREGIAIGDIWSDIFPINSQAIESLNYPTQKPEALLERIIKASSNPGDLVFDCFMGSGTTQAVAMKLGRRFIGADINLGAVQTTTKRLLKVAEELKTKQGELFSQKTVAPTSTGSVTENSTEKNSTFNSQFSTINYLAFEVYNVNDYEFFRNELEAKRLICEAMGMEQLTDSNVYDALYEGRKVSILGINRIATASEFAKLLSNVNIHKAG